MYNIEIVNSICYNWLLYASSKTKLKLFLGYGLLTVIFMLIAYEIP